MSIGYWGGNSFHWVWRRGWLRRREWRWGRDHQRFGLPRQRLVDVLVQPAFHTLRSQRPKRVGCVRRVWIGEEVSGNHMPRIHSVADPTSICTFSGTPRYIRAGVAPNDASSIGGGKLYPAAQLLLYLHLAINGPTPMCLGGQVCITPDSQRIIGRHRPYDDRLGTTRGGGHQLCPRKRR